MQEICTYTVGDLLVFRILLNCLKCTTYEDYYSNVIKFT